MEKYRVINSFKDLEDNNHIYIKNKDIYPREGLEPTKKRIKELTSTKNKIGKVLIEKIEESIIVENDAIVINEEDIVDEKELSEDETIEIIAPEVIIEEKKEEVNSEEVEKSEKTEK